MGTLNSKGAYDCLAKLERNPDMPFFLLLASDRSAPATVRHWASKALVAGVDPQKVAQAYEVAVDMEAWQAAHPEKEKAPG